MTNPQFIYSFTYSLHHPLHLWDIGTFNNIIGHLLIQSIKASPVFAVVMGSIPVVIALKFFSGLKNALLKLLAHCDDHFIHSTVHLYCLSYNYSLRND